MAAPEPSTLASDRTPLWRNVTRGAALLLVLIAAFSGMTAATCAWHVYESAREKPPETQTIVRATPDVITAVRDLARLESAEFHIERVIDLKDRQERLMGFVHAEDAILLVAAGDVVAGVDFSEMRDGDIVTDEVNHTATVAMPPPRVFSARLDGQRTFVHTRRTDVLAKRSETLETRARAEAERTIQQSAVEGGILERAKRSAEQTISTLLGSLGFQRVEIRWRNE